MNDRAVVARWTARLAIRKRLEGAARRRHVAHPTRSTRLALEKRKRQVEEARRVIARHSRALNRTVAFDGTPTMRGLALVLQDCRDHGWRGHLSSSDRRRGVAERYGKLSQYALYVAYWVKHLAGYAPANRPGQSTHELRSDGHAYRGPVGRPLAWWQLGLDVSEDAQLVRIARRLGYDLRHPYRSGAEAHHVNLYANPAKRLRARRLA